MNCNQSSGAPAGDAVVSDMVGAYLSMRAMVRMTKMDKWDRGDDAPAPIGYVVDETTKGFEYGGEDDDDEDKDPHEVGWHANSEPKVITSAGKLPECVRHGKMVPDADALRGLMNRGKGGAAEALWFARRAIRKGECYYAEGVVCKTNYVDVANGNEWKRVPLFSDGRGTARKPFDTLAELCVAAREAPFGDLRTMQTVVDSTVRVAFEIGEGSFKVDERVMADWLVKIAKEIEATLMGGARGVMLRPYKLNVYGKGGFFKPHVDTPVGGGMLGTVVLALPVPHEGGQLIVHGNTPVEFESSRMNRDGFRWCAFFGDCVHEVAPVTDGARVTMTFLILPRQDSAPVCQVPLSRDTCVISAGRPSEQKAVMLRSVVAEACAVLARCCGGTIGLLLDHSYTLSSLDAAGERVCLKGVDHEIYRALAEAVDDGGDGERPRLVLMPVVQHRHEERVLERSYGSQNCEHVVYSCREADIMYVAGLTKVKPPRPFKRVPFFEDGLADDAGPKGRVLDLDFTQGSEYTGNEASNNIYDGVYFRGALIATYVRGIEGNAPVPMECDDDDDD